LDKVAIINKYHHYFNSAIVLDVQYQNQNIVFKFTVKLKKKQKIIIAFHIPYFKNNAQIIIIYSTKFKTFSLLLCLRDQQVQADYMLLILIKVALLLLSILIAIHIFWDLCEL